mmetsp:Transcript_31666/g.48196  ORF Transcript_31666/g.48196 Transcript_31666/m.48196 type:complete len:92 (-) Transcript_31666:78-353(-)
MSTSGQPKRNLLGVENTHPPYFFPFVILSLGSSVKGNGENDASPYTVACLIAFFPIVKVLSSLKKSPFLQPSSPAPQASPTISHSVSPLGP